jgi:hypothetical protein
MVEGYGYGVLTQEFAARYLESKDLIVLNSGKSYVNSLVLAWYDRPEPPAYFCHLLDVIL